MATAQVQIIVKPETPHVHQWTCEEYHKMAEASLFNGQRVELIEGEIIDKESLPRVHLWTRAEYYRMGKIGLFRDKRVELIEGQVIDMSAMGSPRVTAVMLATRAVGNAFGEGWAVRVQAPLKITLGMGADPEPDVAVVEGDIRDCKNEHPQTAALLIEVADTSVKYDRQRKGSLYARAWIDDYWIINLKKRQLEVYRNPITDALAPFGFKYRDKAIFKEGDSVAPLAKPDSLIAVADLLP